MYTVADQVFLKSFLASSDQVRNAVKKAIRRLLTDRFHPGLRVKRLKSRSKKAVWECRYSDAGRITFTFGRHFKDGAEETFIHLWNLLKESEHDAVSEVVRRREYPELFWLDDEMIWPEREWSNTLPANPEADLSAIDDLITESDDPWEAYEMAAQDLEPLIENPPDGIPWYFFDLDEIPDEAHSFASELLLTKEQYELLALPLPILLEGSAGSGKTTVALYMMRNYLASHPEVRSLYLTLSKPLSKQARRLFGYLSSGEQLLDRADFLTYEQLAAKLGVSFESNRVLSWSDFNNVTIQSALPPARRLTAWSEIQLNIKGSLVSDGDGNIEGAGNLDHDQYVSMSDRNSFLSGNERSVLYQNEYSTYRKYLETNQKYDLQDIARLLIQTKTEDSANYGTVFIDEAQDFSEKQLYSVARHLMPTASNSFFLTGDPIQSIFGRRMPWPIAKSLFSFNGSVIEEERLSHNFRSRRRIVEFAEQVAQAIRRYSKDHYHLEQEGLSEGGIVRTVPATELKNQLGDLLGDGFVAILTTSNSRKKKLVPTCIESR